VALDNNALSLHQIADKPLIVRVCAKDLAIRSSSKNTAVMRRGDATSNRHFLMSVFQVTLRPSVTGYP
jgi:hypothetical protein